MTGRLYINSKDAYTTWGVALEDGAEEALLLPPELKEVATNDATTAHGTQYFGTVRLAEREVQVPFVFTASSDYLTRYKAFVDELLKGELTLSVTELGVVYNLRYKEAKSYTSAKWAGRLTVTFIEPNPANRT